MCKLPQSRGGACFCTRGAVKGYDVVLLILALAKTVTPVGVPGGSRGSLCRQPHNYPFKSENSRGTEANDIYRPVTSSFYSSLIKEKNLSLNFKDFLSLGKGI